MDTDYFSDRRRMVSFRMFGFLAENRYLSVCIGVHLWLDERFQVKLQCRLEIGDRGLIRISLSDNDAPDPKRIGDVCIRVFLHYDFEWFHQRCTSANRLLERYQELI